MIFRTSLLFLPFIVVMCSAKTHPPLVQTAKGKIKGLFERSEQGNQYYSFRGIPYAKPPVGPLRFKPPEEVDAWSYELNAEKDANCCIQKNYLFGKAVEGSEDCLYLNVYTPKINAEASKLMPVMVFIHWGGFFTGYSSSQYLGPDYFMDKNVVLVTFNYRLGIFGFLSTFSDEAPGNYGLKDQVAVLEWVQKNIHTFGGDKEKVTLFGQSAGAASVHFHMFHPKSQNLFHRAISQSGTALALWAKPLGEEQKQITQYQAILVGCGHFANNTEKLVNCLRQIDAKTLVESGDKFKVFSIDPLTVYLPSIEKKSVRNPEPFLTKQPIEYIANGEFKRVPWILGTVRDEGIIRAAGLVSQPNDLKRLNKDFDQLMPTLMALQISTPKGKIQNVWRKIKNYYFAPGDISMKNRYNIQGLINLYTDRSFAYTTFQSALLHAKKNHTAVWLYDFQYQGTSSYKSHFATYPDNFYYKWGISHCDDLLYLFKSPALFPDLTNAKDIEVRNALITLWTNFATFGNPTPDSNITKWLPANTDTKTSKKVFNKNLKYLEIFGNYYMDEPVYFAMRDNFYRDQFKFWESLPLVENIDELNQRHVEL